LGDWGSVSGRGRDFFHFATASNEVEELQKFIKLEVGKLCTVEKNFKVKQLKRIGKGKVVPVLN
jgi:hypothetical protein